jgi:hypothetical protein
MQQIKFFSESSSFNEIDLGLVYPKLMHTLIEFITKILNSLHKLNIVRPSVFI